MRKIFLSLCLCGCMSALAGTPDDPYGKLTLTGSVQSDMLVPTKLTDDMPEHFITNTYVDLRLMNRHFEMGGRIEYLDHPMPGFEKDFKGKGVPHLYIKAVYDKWNLTYGTFYEQFGSGFILRTYEERSLGIDNSLLGVRLAARPFKGVSVKVLSGTQRTYWDLSKSVVTGADGELSLDEWIKPLADKGVYLTVGGSWVNKYEEDEVVMVDATHRINFPKYVNAWDARVRLQTGGLNILAEYARKTDDPIVTNNYIFKPGQVAMLSMTYSKKGLSTLLQAKRSENMSFRSLRSEARLTPSYLNHLPAFTLDHTYALAALYPYATQSMGEWAYQAELGYKFKKGTPLGGKYGTNVKLNASYVRDIDMQPVGGQATEGYRSSFMKWGDSQLYHDFNVQIDKKFTKAFKLNFMYMNQCYNKTAVEGHGGLIHSNIFVADGKYQIARKTTLRAEAQYLQTKDDDGDWVFGLLELSLAPHWMFTVSDMYNCGETKEHFYQGSVTFNWNAHRLQAGFGRTREGFNCTGGVCRRVPETKGFTLSYNYNF